jgi:hypothetical protein
VGRGTDVSPRGDAPGFARVLDDHTIVIPDRPGKVPQPRRMATLVDTNTTPIAKLQALQEAGAARNIALSIHQITRGGLVRAHGAARVRCAELILDRAHGKPAFLQDPNRDPDFVPLAERIKWYNRRDAIEKAEGKVAGNFQPGWQRF